MPPRHKIPVAAPPPRRQPDERRAVSVRTYSRMHDVSERTTWRAIASGRLRVVRISNKTVRVLLD
jgi:hypothetical protein